MAKVTLEPLATETPVLLLSAEFKVIAVGVLAVVVWIVVSQNEPQLPIVPPAPTAPEYPDCPEYPEKPDIPLPEYPE